MKSFNNDKSELAVILRESYETQKGMKDLDEETKKILKRKPHYAVLFEENHYDLLLVLEIEMD